MDKLAKAKAKNVRGSARKARLVADAIRGMDLNMALAQLKYMNKRVATDVLKVISSAAANAQDKFGMNSDSLYVKEIFVDEAPTYKRFRAGSKGRGMRILKRNCHITAVVTQKNEESSTAKGKDKQETKSKNKVNNSK